MSRQIGQFPPHQQLTFDDALALVCHLFCSPKTSVFRSASAPPRVILENVSRDSYRLWCDRAKVSCSHAAIAEFCWCFPV